ncbi:MAG: hypothetical protein IPJ64_00500 [Saprospiraceae bacterium]|nr:hypothetical protein [Saprospiraceae bacterium]
MELGPDKSQGLDYQYTLQGWIKGVNGIGFQNKSFEPGKDSDPSNTNINKLVARDAAFYNIGYNSSDYKPIKSSLLFGLAKPDLTWPKFTSILSSNNNDKGLYNGNISYLLKQYPGAVGFTDSIYAQTFRYDQLHRINTDSTYLFSNTSGFWANSPKHSSNYAYDANGNLTRLSRFATSTTSAMDSLNYYYSSSLRPNLLSSVTDNVSPTSYDDDIDNQLPGNYSYDSIGNLVSDLQSKASISWDPYQKIRKVIRNITVLGTGGSYTYDQTERFDYDPQGQRTSKKMTKSYNLDSTAHYYLRDAQGNAIAIYKKTYVNIGLSSTYIQAECNIFGSSRVGVYYPPDRSMISDSPGRIATRYRNYRRYEVSNHLGNVMSVVTDRLKGNPAALPQRVSAYEPDIVAAQDYYPFGQVMRGRNFPTLLGKSNFPTKYRYGFNDKEADTDGEIQNLTTYDYGFRIYNPGIARFLSVDHKAADAPGWSPYRAFCCNPIRYTDPDGQWEWDATGNLVAQKGDNSYSMAKFLGTSQSNAMQMLNRGGVTANSKGVLNLKEGQSFAQSSLWVGTKSASGPVVNNTKEATSHYFNGNGAAADVGDQSTRELLSSAKFNEKHTKITTQKVQAEGNFSVDLTSSTFHIGRTNVEYSVSGNGKSSSVTYTLFSRDGFWDPDFVDENVDKFVRDKIGFSPFGTSLIPDQKGPNLERGGTPYDYKTRERTYFFKPVEEKK